MQIINKHLTVIDKLISSVDLKLDELTKHYQSAIDLLCSIPGVSKNSAINIISEIARMILVAIYHILVTGEKFNPSDLYKFDMPEELKQRQREKAIRQAIKLLKKEEITDLNIQIQ